MSTSYIANGTTFFNGTNCLGNLVPSGASAGWCLKQNGHPRIETCCEQLGNGTVFIQDGCNVWCDVNTADPSSDFTRCLKANNSTYTGGLSCSNADTRLANETSSGDDDTSASAPVYNAPKATVLAVLCGILALSVLHL